MKVTMHFHNYRMRRLLAAGLLPERAGQPVKALVHVSLADLMLLDGSSALMDEWIAGVRAQWAAARAAASESGSDGGAWLDGDGARSFTCDASVTPVVTGEVNPAALDDLIRLCTELGQLRHGHGGEDDLPRTREALEQQSSARPSTYCPARAAWRASCAAGSWGRGWARRVCRSTSACPLTSRRRSVAR